MGTSNIGVFRRTDSSGATSKRIGLSTGAIIVTAMMSVVAGCQVAPQPTVRTLIQRQSFLDLTGLLPRKALERLDVTMAVPRDWIASDVKRMALFTHQQFRSPSGRTGVGVARVRLPLPLSASAIAWFAKNEYTKRASPDQKDGKLLARWTDGEGREWFEAENGKYHAKGYVIARGLDAWIVYSGHRTAHAPDPKEIGISERSAQSVVPIH